LNKANLTEAHLVQADLSYATCIRANFFNADLFYADVLGITFSYANLHRANLSAIKNLPKASDLLRVVISGAKMDHKNLVDTNWTLRRWRNPAGELPYAEEEPNH
jgi:uncharacterized protein YjbI with pentapeptide repeats